MHIPNCLQDRERERAAIRACSARSSDSEVRCPERSELRGERREGGEREREGISKISIKNQNQVKCEVRADIRYTIHDIHDMVQMMVLLQRGVTNE